MREESTAVTSMQAVEAARGDGDDALTPPCAGCGLRNPAGRRSCLACGSPLGINKDEGAGPLPVDLPMLERDAEAAAIDQAVQRLVEARQGGAIAVIGPRGVGATRLLRHTAERLLAAGGVRLLTTTVREADGPYAPVTRLLWERFGVTPLKGLQTARGEIVAEVHRVLATRAAPPTEHARRIVVAAGLPTEGTGQWESPSHGGATARIGESVARFLATDAEAQPIALLIDNLDEASDDGIALLRHVIQGVARAPVLVVAAGEPGLRERLGDAVVGRYLEPRPLSPEASEALCHQLLPGLTLVPDELLEAVLTRSGGAPGKLREIVLALIESRVIIPDEVPWRLDLAALGPAGPVSTADLLGVRVAQLDAEAQSVLRRAAVVGEVFWEGAVVAMSRIEDSPGDPFGDDVAQRQVFQALRRLVAAELVAAIEESELALERQYAFAVPGLREMVLAQQDEPTRARRHDIVAGWLELAAGPRADDLARAIAGHLEKAGLKQAAAREYLRAARAARASYRGPQAVQLFDKALACLAPGDAPARIDALHDKGVVLSLLGRMDDANAAYAEMLQIAHRYGARNKMAAAMGRLGRLARTRGDLEEARALWWRALELFQQAEDLRGIAGVQDDLGTLAYLAGDFDTAIAHSTQALEIRRELDDPRGEALSTFNLGLVHLARGQPRQARAYFERSLALREEHGDIEGTVTTRNALAVLAYERGDIDQAEANWRELLELSEALGDQRMITIATHNLGEAAILRGDVELAQRLLDDAEAAGQRMGDPRVMAEIERSRGALARLAGDADRAREHLERSLAVARTLGVREAEALALRGLGEVCAMTVFDESGEVARQAEGFFNEATRILEELGATRELARTRAVFGAYLLERGDVMNGRKVLTMAVPVLEQLELAEAAQARIALTAAGGEVIVPGIGALPPSPAR